MNYIYEKGVKKKKKKKNFIKYPINKCIECQLIKQFNEQSQLDETYRPCKTRCFTYGKIIHLLKLNLFDRANDPIQKVKLSVSENTVARVLKY